MLGLKVEPAVIRIFFLCGKKATAVLKIGGGRKKGEVIYE